VVRSVAFEPFNIPSGSMIPTLLIGDYLFVSKYSYGYSRYSLPFGLPLIPGPGRLFYHEPKRGDVVVFKWPVDNSTDYIKRVIGVPGDRIRVTHGVLYVNDQPCPIEPDPNGGGDGSGYGSRSEIETLLPNIRHKVMKPVDSGFFNEWPSADEARWRERQNLNPKEEPLKAFRRDFKPNLLPAQDDSTKFDLRVPDGQFLMMGDNRDNSSDGRIWGLVPAENLVGRAEFIFFATNGEARFWEIWKWPFAIRYERLFTGVR
jgi:signal peptidase I